MGLEKNLPFPRPLGMIYAYGADQMTLQCLPVGTVCLSALRQGITGSANSEITHFAFLFLSFLPRISQTQDSPNHC